MFYKLLEDGTITYGPYVLSGDYELISDFHQDYVLPIDGWHWFNTLDEANVFFGITN